MGARTEYKQYIRKHFGCIFW